MQTRDYFLIDPDNEQFAAGASHKPAACGQGYVLFFLGLFALGGLLVAGIVMHQWMHLIEFSNNYVETQGQALDCAVESDASTPYCVAYRFVVGDQAYTVEESVGKTTYHSIKEGQPLTVRHAKHDPSIATIEPGHPGELLALTGFCLLWNGAVSRATWLLARQNLKRRKLTREGQQIVGQVARCSGLQNSDGDFVLKTKFGFRSPQTGVWIESKSLQVRQDLRDKLLPPPGTAVYVLYLDDETFLAL
jgi:hypothetical protein